jgi:hypothetical protein
MMPASDRGLEHAFDAKIVAGARSAEARSLHRKAARAEETQERTLPRCIKEFIAIVVRAVVEYIIISDIQ